ncbi:chromosome segregation ATPase [Bradyrhizobium sp. LM6.10]
MAILKMAAAAEQYRIPSLAEASPEFAALLQKQSDLYALQSKLNGERRDIQKQLDEAGSAGPMVPVRVAELLGDEADSAPMLRKQAADIRARLADVETALEIVRRRLSDAKGPASHAVCQIVKPEYGKRVAAIAKVLEALAAARADYDDLRNQFEAEDIAWGSLVPLSLGFLGDPRGDGQIPRFMREAREAGYDV